VPCGYLAQGIYIQWRQLTDSIYDFRVNFRLSSGAIKLAEVSLNDCKWLPLEKVNPDQYTLVDYQQSQQVLSQSTFSFRFTNHKGEHIIAKNLLNRVGKDGFGRWHKTKVNFKHT
jgi:hypothetical protein